MKTKEQIERKLKSLMNTLEKTKFRQGEGTYRYSLSLQKELLKWVLK